MTISFHGSRFRGSETPKIVGVTATWLALSIVAIFVGLLAAVLPWFLLAPVAILPIIIVLALTLPEVAVCLLLAAVFGAVPPQLLPPIPVLGGSLRPEDLGIIALLILLLVKQLGGVTANLFAVRPYIFPLATLGVLVVSSVFISALIYKTPTKDVFNEFRSFYYWLLLPLIALAVDNDDRLRRFKILLLCLAVWLAAAVAFQSFTGLQVLQRGQFMGVHTIGETSSGVIRSTSPGMFLMVGSLLYIVASFAMGRRIPIFLFLILAVVLALGILVGFGRGLWISAILGFIFLAIYSQLHRYLFMMVVAILVGLVFLGILNQLKPDYVQSATSRLFSVGAELKEGTSFGRRTIENTYALESIFDSPFGGVGLGAKYKPPTVESRGWDGETRYIHNSYIGVATKIGLPGLISVLWLVLVMMIRAWRALAVRGVDRPIGFAAFWILFTIAVLTSFTQPDLTSPHGVATICVILFLIETILRSVTDRKSESKILPS